MAVSWVRPRFIDWRDDVYAAVGHRLTHLVIHAGPLHEKYAGDLFVLGREARGADVCGWFVGVERHQESQVPRAIEPEGGSDDFRLLAKM